MSDWITSKGVCVSIHGPADAYWRKLSLGNKGNCHLKWDHHNNKKCIVNCISKQPCAGFANVCVYKRFIQLHSLCHLDRQFNKNVFFFSKNTQKRLDSGFRHDECICVPLQLRRAARWNSCAAHSIIKKRYFLRWLAGERENLYLGALRSAWHQARQWKITGVECKDKFSAS